MDVATLMREGTEVCIGRNVGIPKTLGLHCAQDESQIFSKVIFGSGSIF